MKKIVLLLSVLASVAVLAGCSHNCCCQPEPQPCPQPCHHHDYKGEVK